jgi:hypothetical protein
MAILGAIVKDALMLTVEAVVAVVLMEVTDLKTGGEQQERDDGVICFIDLYPEHSLRANSPRE